MSTRPFFVFLTLLVLTMCSTRDGNEEMNALLNSAKVRANAPANSFHPNARLKYVDSLLAIPNINPGQESYRNYLRAGILLELGREKEAVSIYEGLNLLASDGQRRVLLRDMGISYLRQGERANCIAGHAAASCVLPIHGLGVHQDKTGSLKAIDVYTKIVRNNPDDLESRWLLNLAYMTVNEYPENVPADLLIPGMEGDTIVKVKPFNDIAGGLAIDVNDMSGGSIVDDFDNDGYLDIVTSSIDLEEPMHYFQNLRDGRFADISESSGLNKISGGLNLLQADYDNDGDKDILVLRGAWKGEFGEEPNSLLRNNGDRTFTDVTTQAGILTFHPTQTATWNDFNNDGWLDLYVGNESDIVRKLRPCEFYINNHDGTFTEIAAKAGADVKLFVKAVTSGDYDNDGWQDIFISTMNDQRVLLRNMGINNGNVTFRNVTAEAHIDRETNRTFTSWFFDYDNDGWLDIFSCDYTYARPLSFYTAAEKLGRQEGCQKKILLYHNNHDGTFTEVATDLGLNRTTFGMGGNFGDIDNDGYLDMYVGTGNPQYQSLVPNKMYKNMDGVAFADVTNTARVGHLQKGHAVSFADVDNDGDQDIYTDMGGIYTGDSYPSSFFLNPGQNDNRWIALTLEGNKSNRGAIGARIRMDVIENGVRRSIYRDVNSGGSFGASPLRREIGLGMADRIELLEITWPGQQSVQRFQCIEPNQFLTLKEGDNFLQPVRLNKIDWAIIDPLCMPN